jgi:hypothetical protein
MPILQIEVNDSIESFKAALLNGITNSEFFILPFTDPPEAWTENELNGFMTSK